MSTQKHLPQLKPQLKEVWKVVGSRSKDHLGRLSLFGGIFLTIVGYLFVFLMPALQPSSVDIRSKATEDNQKAILNLVAPETITLGDNVNLDFLLTTTPETYIDGIQMAIAIPKDYFGEPTLTINPSQNIKLLHNETEETSQSFIIKLIITNKNFNQPMTATTTSPLFTITALATKNGIAQITHDQELSMATLFHVQPSRDILEVNLTEIVIGDDNSSDNQDPEATPTPIPTTNPNHPSLDISFKLQGVNKANVVVNAQATFKETPSSESPTSIQVAFKSNDQGIFHPIQPISLINLTTDSDTKYQVAVKTTVSLNKILGEMEFAEGKNTQPTTWSTKELMVGDFFQTGDGYNKIDISDIGLVFSQYNQLSTPATGEVKKFDVNYDGVFDLSDISIVLANYTQLEITGDEL